MKQNDLIPFGVFSSVLCILIPVLYLLWGSPRINQNNQNYPPASAPTSSTDNTQTTNPPPSESEGSRDSPTNPAPAPAILPPQNTGSNNTIWIIVVVVVVIFIVSLVLLKIRRKGVKKVRFDDEPKEPKEQEISRLKNLAKNISNTFKPKPSSSSNLLPPPSKTNSPPPPPSTPPPSFSSKPPNLPPPPPNVDLPPQKYQPKPKKSVNIKNINIIQIKNPGQDLPQKFINNNPGGLERIIQNNNSNPKRKAVLQQILDFVKENEVEASLEKNVGIYQSEHVPSIQVKNVSNYRQENVSKKNTTYVEKFMHYWTFQRSEHSKTTYFMDFANIRLGGAWESHGDVQEERMVLHFPEFASILARANPDFATPDHKKVLLTTRTSLKCIPNVSTPILLTNLCAVFDSETDGKQTIGLKPITKKMRDCQRTNIIAVAAHKINGRNVQYTPEIIQDLFENIYHALRLVKEYHTQKHGDKPLSFVTGLWGCGVFNHNFFVSVLVQKVAIAMVLDPTDYVIFTGIDPKLQKDLEKLISPSGLYNLFKDQDQLEDISRNIFNYVQAKGWRSKP
jgi:hypothetical protein